MKKSYLYVLLLPHMDRECNLGYKIKFGYSENFKKRLREGYESYYGAESVKVLYLYEGNFTVDDESRVKQHLKSYLLFGDEWYRYCQEVLKFFDTNNTSEKLKTAISNLPPIKSRDGRSFHKVDYNIIEYIIKTKFFDISNDLIKIQNKRKELYLELRDYNNRKQIEYACITYQVQEEDLIVYLQEIKDRQQNMTSKSKELMEKFNQAGDTTLKLKFLVGISEDKSLKKEDINAFLEMIPNKFRDYYVIVGPKIIRACSYQEQGIKKEWERLVYNKKRLLLKYIKHLRLGKDILTKI